MLMPPWCAAALAYMSIRMLIKGSAKAHVACQRKTEREVAQGSVDDGNEQELALLQLGEDLERDAALGRGDGLE